VNLVIKQRIRMNQEKFEEASAWRQEFEVIAQLFVITGIWWIFELITTYLTWREDLHNCALNFILDTPNLLAGFLIFMATVFKKSVVMGLQEKTGIKIFKDKSQPSEISNTVTKDTIVGSTAM